MMCREMIGGSQSGHNLSVASGGSVLIYGARLCEPQHVALKITLLRVTDPRSESNLGHTLSGRALDFRGSNVILLSFRV